MRTFSFIDKIISELDTALQTVSPPNYRYSTRPSPAEKIAEPHLMANEKQHSAGLMRINHTGEVCAQALYQGQALTARLPHVKEQMSAAALEEVDHLAWCEQRLDELESRPSYLNFFWYGSSMLLGALAGLAGDKISLGFVAETEQQVSAHLQEHLKKLPKADIKSKLIIEQMQIDEEEHAHQAKAAGGIELPVLVKQLMTGMSVLMTKTSYFI